MWAGEALCTSVVAPVFRTEPVTARAYVRGQLLPGFSKKMHGPRDRGPLNLPTPLVGSSVLTLQQFDSSWSRRLGGIRDVQTVNGWAQSRESYHGKRFSVRPLRQLMAAPSRTNFAVVCS